MMENELRYTITLDDDPSVCKFIARATGINSLPYTSGEALLKRSSTYDPVAVFVDVHLDTYGCGLDVVPALRSFWPFTPIIVVTSDASDELVGNALAMGANDFVRKPISAVELNGRLHARIRELSAKMNADVLSIGDLRFCSSNFSLMCKDKITYLPKLEAQLLIALFQNRSMVVSRGELKRRLWGEIAVSDNTLDKKISGIRKAFSQIGSEMKIQSIYGKGIVVSYADQRSNANGRRHNDEQ